jgi:hypothetical protein
MVSAEKKESSKPWVPPVAGLVGGIIGLLIILIASNNLIGAAGVGLIIFFVIWRNLKKYYRQK